jgi:hypothetical protein
MENENSNVDKMLFIYGKKGKIKVFDLEDWPTFKEKGKWNHLSTIDPKIYIEHLLNLSDEEVIKEINALKNG